MAPTAIVTGSAQGIGAAIALRLAKDGYNIAINDLPAQMPKLEDVRKQILSQGVRCEIFTGDVSDEDAVKNMVEEVVKEFHDGLDVMIANAGSSSTYSPLVETSGEQFKRIMSVNAGGVFFCYKHAAIQMIKQGRGGRIIGASSGAGLHGSSPGLSAYSASKFAIRGLTQTAAVELGSHGITVNAYAPGVIDTELSSNYFSSAPGDSDTNLTNLLNVLPLKRMGKVEDIASVVSYLVSQEAGYITGQTIQINGGVFLS